MKLTLELDKNDIAHIGEPFIQLLKVLSQDAGDNNKSIESVQEDKTADEIFESIRKP